MGYQALLFCPDEKTARSVTLVLGDLDFAVEPCTEPFGAVKKLMAQHFDAVVVDCDNEQNATLLFKSARNSNANQSSLAVAVVEGQAGVAKAFRIGANLVLTKPINIEQAKGTLRVARGLLRKGADAAKAAPSAPVAPAPAAVPPISSTKLTSIFASAPPASATGQAPKRQALMPSSESLRESVMVPSSNALSAQQTEPDTILESDETEVLEVPPPPVMKPAPVASAAPAPTAPALGTSRFPWQPTAKPGAEPMASAPRRAAEAATKSETTENAPKPSEEKQPPFLGLHFRPRTAAAPAPTKELAPEKSQSISSAPAIAAVASNAADGEAALEKPPFAGLSSHEPAPPTFFPGFSDRDEAEEGSKTKALIIIAAVVLLAASAAFLSWRKLHDKDAPQVNPAASTPAAPASGPAIERSKPENGKPSPAMQESEITLGSESAGKHAAKPAPAYKPAVKEQASTAEEPEVTQRLIVKNETNAPMNSSPAPDQDPVQAPSAIGVGAAADPKALTNISSAPLAVPKPSPQVVRVSQGVMEGLVLKRVAPRYPTQALQMRIQGSVQLQATISKTGDITNLKILSGDGVLARAAQDAVKQWKYKPYYLDGEPVEIQTQILMNFKLPN